MPRDAGGSCCLQGLQKGCSAKGRALNISADFAFGSGALGEVQDAGMWAQDEATPPRWCAGKGSPPLSPHHPWAPLPGAPPPAPTPPSAWKLMWWAYFTAESIPLLSWLCSYGVNFNSLGWAPHLLKFSAGWRFPWALTWSHAQYQKPSLSPFQRVWLSFELFMTFQNEKNLPGLGYFTKYFLQPYKNLTEGKKEWITSAAATPTVLRDVSSWLVTNNRLLLLYKTPQ